MLNIAGMLNLKKALGMGRAEADDYVLPENKHAPVYRLQVGSVLSVEYAGDVRPAVGGVGRVNHRFLF